MRKSFCSSETETDKPGMKDQKPSFWTRDKKFKMFVEVTVRYWLSETIKRGVVVMLDFPQGGGSVRITRDTLQDLTSGIHSH